MACVEQQQQMNIIQVIVAFVLFTIAAASSLPQLVATVAKSSYASGSQISYTVTVSGSTQASYTVSFVDEYGTTATVTATTTSSTAVSYTPSGLYGTVTMTAIAVDQTSFQNSLPVNFYIYTSLSFTSPSGSNPTITYGQPVTLEVDVSGPTATEYTATFTCPTGVFMITGLNIGQAYDIVPAGIYGGVVITVTAENASPATFLMTIAKPTANIPPAFVPGRMLYYPSVYATMKKDGNVEIVSVEYLTSPPM